MVLIIPCALCCGGVWKTVRLLYQGNQVNVIVCGVGFSDLLAVPFDEQGLARRHHVIQRNQSSWYKLGAWMSELQKHLPASHFIVYTAVLPTRSRLTVAYNYPNLTHDKHRDRVRMSAEQTAGQELAAPGPVRVPRHGGDAGRVPGPSSTAPRAPRVSKVDLCSVPARGWMLAGSSLLFHFSSCRPPSLPALLFLP